MKIVSPIQFDSSPIHALFSPSLEGELTLGDSCTVEDLRPFASFTKLKHWAPQNIQAVRFIEGRGEWITGENGSLIPIDEQNACSSLISGGFQYTVDSSSYRGFVLTKNWQPRGALFLDRDGILNRDDGYLFRFEEMVLNEELFSLIHSANDLKMPVIVLTNQSGVARGFYSTTDVEKVHLQMKNFFAREGLKIDRFYYCPDHPDFDNGQKCLKGHSEWRKPGVGMLALAASEFGIDLSRSWMVGDKGSDILGHYGLRVALLGDRPVTLRNVFPFLTLSELVNWLSSRLHL